ncbi:MAG: hypothetical protein HDS66_09710 [Bacteroidales bacterium]|nr:hypothetical protein [Bacteroidales bacterium]
MEKIYIYIFIWYFIEDANCKLIRIREIANHVHLLVEINPTIPLSKLVQKIKAFSSGGMRTDSRFSTFMGWGKSIFHAQFHPNINTM